MKNLTADEILKILSHAKNLGVSQVKVEGLEVSFMGVPIPGTSVEEKKSWDFPVRERNERNRRNGRFCSKCSSALRPSQYTNGFYCHECHLRRKEARFQQNQGTY